MYIPSPLQAVANTLTAEQSSSASPRVLLSWFGAHRRGYRIAKQIQDALVSLGIETDPPFQHTWIDGSITFRKLTPTLSGSSAGATGTSSGQVLVREAAGTTPAISDLASPVDISTITSISLDPTYRIGKLAAANNAPSSVSPDDSLSKAITIMTIHDYSQLPIIQGDRNVKGIISWKSIAQTAIVNKAPTKALECMEPANIVSSEMSLFGAIPGIIQNGHALIRSNNNLISGIVTTTDLGVQLVSLGEPFLLLSEIENYLRKLVDRHFSITDLKAAKNPTDPREIAGAEDLSFGEYIRLLENPERWDLLKLTLDRVVFTKGLENIRKLRNDIMHFSPDEPDVEEILTLRNWAKFFQTLANLEAI